MAAASVFPTTEEKAHISQVSMMNSQVAVERLEMKPLHSRHVDEEEEMDSKERGEWSDIISYF